MKGKWLVIGALAAAELVLGGAIVLTLWQSVGVLRSDGLQVHFFEFDNYAAEADEEQRAGVAGPATLEVDDRLGTITVVAGPAGEIVIAAHKQAWGPSQAEAQERLASLRVMVTQTGDTVAVQVVQPPEVAVIGEQRSNRVNLVITAPAATAVTARSGFGDISLSGTQAGANLATGNGDVTVSEVSGDLTLESDFGDIVVEQVESGQIQAHSDNGTVRVSGAAVDGLAALSSNFGDLRMEAGSAGSLDVETDNGVVELIDLQVAGPALVRSAFGNLTLTNVAARSYDLHSDNGKITVDGASGSVLAGSEFGDIRITGGENVTLDLETANGRIDFAGSLGAGPHVVTSNFGDLNLTLPADAALSLDLQTDFGQIDTQLPLTLAGSADQTHLSGTVNGGGASLTASTDNGNITLGVLGS